MTDTLTLLSKLLANENITLQRGNFHTASFDVKQRVLRLPTLLGMSETEELMLIFHEVGHALFTDITYFDAVDKHKVDKPNFADYMNVLEDVRIERKIKTMYPGSRRDFFTGYKSLVDRDFFGVKTMNIDKMSFIDRINMYYKAGSASGVKFSTEELPLVNAVDDTNTVADVVELSLRIYMFATLKRLEQKAEQQHQTDSEEEDAETQQAETDSNKVDSEEGDAEEDAEEDEVDEEGAPEAVTQETFDNNIEASVSTRDKIFVAPELSSAHYHISFAQFSKGQLELNNPLSISTKRQSIRRAASYMHREFEIKKSATRYARQTQSHSGALDTRKLHQYRTSDDIFRKYNVVLDDKNHGMVVLLDFSGSMSQVIGSAIAEIYTLVTFCNMAKIPFRVYMFVSESPPDRYGVYRTEPALKPNTLVGKTMTLVEIATSAAPFQRVELAMEHMMARNFGGFRRINTPLTEALILLLDIIPKFKIQHNLQKVSLITITDGQGNAVDVVNESGGRRFISNGFIADPVTHKKYLISNHLMGNNIQHVVMNLLKERYSYLTTIGYFIVDKLSRGNIGDFTSTYGSGRNVDEIDAVLSLKKDNTIKVKAAGYDSMIIFAGNTIEDDFSIYGLTNKSSVAATAKAFSLGMKAGISNKVVLSNLVQYIS